MANKLLLDKTDPDIADALKDCKVGDTKTFEVTVEVTRDDDKNFEGDVTGITYDEAEATEETGTEGETEGENATATPMEAASEAPMSPPMGMERRGPQESKLKY